VLTLLLCGVPFESETERFDIFAVAWSKCFLCVCVCFGLLTLTGTSCLSAVITEYQDDFNTFFSS
jgi:hypothetical protein